uniref:Uncharacterized protein n=1 Tax=Craspedostauros australis TaxID=1486917 RepID=A0A7R9ZLE1_9STRA
MPTVVPFSCLCHHRLLLYVLIAWMVVVAICWFALCHLSASLRSSEAELESWGNSSSDASFGDAMIGRGGTFVGGVPKSDPYPQGHRMGLWGMETSS